MVGPWSRGSFSFSPPRVLSSIFNAKRAVCFDLPGTSSAFRQSILPENIHNTQIFEFSTPPEGEDGLPIRPPGLVRRVESSYSAAVISPFIIVVLSEPYYTRNA